MPNYNIIIASTARKELKKLPDLIVVKILDKVALLSENPRPNGSIKLAGGGNRHRIRVGDYRVIYSIFDDELIVKVVRAGHRKEVYD
jgi:mRNA interferase RelE/StbE